MLNKRFKYTTWLIPLLILMYSIIGVYAAPITMRYVVNPEFGTLLAGPAGRNFILTTTGTISGVNAGDYIYGAITGMVNIVADNNKAIDILATNLTNDGGISIVNVTCNYHNSGDRDCDLGFTATGKKGRGRDMLIGLEINTTQIHGDNDTAAPSFDIIVNYL